MKIELLGTIITFAGLACLAVSMAIILLGKKVGQDGSGPQKIKFSKYIEVNTNSVVSLVLITACFTIAPLVLTYLNPDMADGVDSKTLREKYLAIDDLTIDIVGPVTLENKEPAEDVSIRVERRRGDSTKVLTRDAGPGGYLDYTLDSVLLSDVYTIFWNNEGYPENKLTFRLNKIKFPRRLRKEGD